MPIRSAALRCARDAAADARYALRTWRQRPGFVAVAVLSLACGIGLNTAVFSIVNSIFLQSIRGVPEPDRVVGLDRTLDYQTYRAIAEGATGMAQFAAWQPVGVDVHAGDLHQRDVAPAVASDYFTVLGVRPLLGRFFVAEPSPTPSTPARQAEVVLDYEFWREVFAADERVIGRTIRLGRVPVTVVGVAPAAFHGFGPERPPLWFPIGLLPAVKGTAPRWDSTAEAGWRVFGRLAPGVEAGQLTAALATLAAGDQARFPGAPLVASVGRERWTGPVSDEKRIEFLLVVVLPLAVVALILWVGCSNVATLLLARAAERRREIAVRLAAGAGRGRLLRMLLTEALLLAAAGAIAGLLVSAWALDALWLTLPEVPRLAVEIDRRVLGYTAFVALGATVIFGLVPALHATRVDVAPLLKGSDADGRSPRRGRLARRFFLVTQFACSMALLLVAATFVRAVVDSYRGPGVALFDRLALASVETDRPAAQRDAFWRGVRERLRQVPGVESVSVLGAGGREVEAHASNGAAAGPRLIVESVDADYTMTAGFIPLQGQRSPLPGRAGELESVVITERAAHQLYGGTSALGRVLTLADGSRYVVDGVVRGPDDQARVLRARTSNDFASAQVLIRTAMPAAAVLARLRAALGPAREDDAIVHLDTLRQAATGFLVRVSRLAAAVGASVLGLALIGLYGAVAFVASLRTREIAIRTAVGAPASAVLRLVAREAAIVVVCGGLLGLAVASTAFRFMSGMIFARWTLDPLTVGPVLLLFALTAAVASVVPGRRALRIDLLRVLQG